MLEEDFFSSRTTTRKLDPKAAQDSLQKDNSQVAILQTRPYTDLSPCNLTARFLQIYFHFDI